MPASRGGLMQQCPEEGLQDSLTPPWGGGPPLHPSFHLAPEPQLRPPPAPIEHWLGHIRIALLIQVDMVGMRQTDEGSDVVSVC